MVCGSSVILEDSTHRSNNNTGVSGSGENLQAELLAKDAGFKIIDMEYVTRARSKDLTYIHQEFLAECIENSVRAPTVLVVDLLEEKIKEVADGGKNWVIVVGFPDSLQQLIGFQRKVVFPNP